MNVQVSITDSSVSPAVARRHGRLAAALVLAGLAVSLLLGALSDGVYQDDDICHFLIARDGWTSVPQLLHAWARPGYNLPTAPVAHFLGMPGCRVLSSLMTAGVAYLAFLIARRLARPGARWPILAPLLVWAQPLVLTLSFTTLTETPAALYVALGLWLYLRGNRVWACAAFSAMFVTRYETLALGLIVAAACVVDALKQNRWKIGPTLTTGWLRGCAAAMLWAPAAYVLAAAGTELTPDASPLTLFSRDYTTEYGSGSPLHFLSVWPEAAGLGVIALAAAGAVALRRKAWLLTTLTAALVALHSYLFWAGRFETGGYSRFLVPLAAPLAVLAAAGLARAWAAKDRAAAAMIPIVVGGLSALSLVSWPWLLGPHSYWAIYVATVSGILTGLLALLIVAGPTDWRKLSSRAAASVACLLLTLQLAVQVRPLPLLCDALHRVVARSVWAVQDEPYADRPAFSQHVLVHYLRRGAASILSNQHAIDTWRDAEPGALFFWESKYCRKPLDPDGTALLLDELTRLGREIHRTQEDDTWAIVFERTAQDAD